MKTPAERIARKRSFVPEKYRKLYDRCIAGKASPREAIRLQCLECWGYVRTEAQTCDNVNCPLFQYNPLKKPAKSLAGAGNSSTIDDQTGGYRL